MITKLNFLLTAFVCAQALITTFNFQQEEVLDVNNLLACEDCRKR